MRDRPDHCGKCLADFTAEPRATHDPDLCWWCECELTDRAVWNAQYAGQTNQTQLECVTWQTR